MENEVYRRTLEVEEAGSAAAGARPISPQTDANRNIRAGPVFAFGYPRRLGYIDMPGYFADPASEWNMKVKKSKYIDVCKEQILDFMKQ